MMKMGDKLFESFKNNLYKFKYKHFFKISHLAIKNMRLLLPQGYLETVV